MIHPPDLLPWLELLHRYLEGEEIKDLIVQLLGTDDKRLAEARCMALIPRACSKAEYIYIYIYIYVNPRYELVYCLFER